MTELERRAAQLRTLLARLGHQHETIEGIGGRLERAEVRVTDGGDPEVVAAIALYLQHYYTAIEDALLRIAEEFDASVPSGEEWHRLLLDQMGLDIPDVRPPVVDPELAGHLHVLRRFRHRVRHAYDQDYDWERMTEPRVAQARTAQLLPSFFARANTVIRQIIEGLEQAT